LQIADCRLQIADCGLQTCSRSAGVRADFDVTAGVTNTGDERVVRCGELRQRVIAAAAA
jgi:hypothetical protein